MRLDGKALDLVKSLAKYKLLKPTQIARLGITSYPSEISTLTKGLIKDKFIDSIDRRGQENVFFIRDNKKVANALGIDIKEVNAPSKSFGYSRDNEPHYTLNINCQIELEMACIGRQTSVELYRKDIDTLFPVLTYKDVSLKPDSAFKVAGKTFLLEAERRDDRNWKDVEQKIRNHVVILNSMISREYFNHNRDHRVLFVIEDYNVLKKSLEFCQQVQGIGDWILFKTRNDVENPVEREKHYFVVGKQREHEGEIIRDTNGRPLTDLSDFVDGWINSFGNKVSLF